MNIASLASIDLVLNYLVALKLPPGQSSYQILFWILGYLTNLIKTSTYLAFDKPLDIIDSFPMGFTILITYF